MSDLTALEPNKGIKDFYDAAAGEWADKGYANEMMLPMLNKFVSLFGKKPHILDAGCGAGYESMRLANLGCDVTGIDFSQESILHRVPRIIDAAKASGFDYYDEWLLGQPIGSWKFLVFKARYANPDNGRCGSDGIMARKSRRPNR